MYSYYIMNTETFSNTIGNMWPMWVNSMSLMWPKCIHTQRTLPIYLPTYLPRIMNRSVQKWVALCEFLLFDNLRELSLLDWRSIAFNLITMIINESSFNAKSWYWLLWTMNMNLPASYKTSIYLTSRHTSLYAQMSCDFNVAVYSHFAFDFVLWMILSIKYTDTIPCCC